jgi:hypothetical protein
MENDAADHVKITRQTPILSHNKMLSRAEIRLGVMRWCNLRFHLGWPRYLIKNQRRPFEWCSVSIKFAADSISQSERGRQQKSKENTITHNPFPKSIFQWTTSAPPPRSAALSDGDNWRLVQLSAHSGDLICILHLAGASSIRREREFYIWLSLSLTRIIIISAAGQAAERLAGQVFIRKRPHS